MRDIHMFIVRKGKVIKTVPDFHSQSWFDNLTGNGDYTEYEELPYVFGWPEGIVPKDLKESFSRDRLYFDHYHIKVNYFIEWFDKYRPNIDAGWATTYQKWMMENKGYKPGSLPDTMPSDSNPADMHFIEYERIADKSKELYNYIINDCYDDDEIDENDYIIYCFDN